MSEITNRAKTTAVTVTDTDQLICESDIDRRQMYATATGGNVWLKFIDEPNNDREGLLIRAGAPFPFGSIPDTIYYGRIYAINETDGETPIINIVELLKE